MIAALVLAAGGSTRLGRPKQSLRVGGGTLLRRTVRAALDGGCRPVVVVLGCGAGDLQDEVAGVDVQRVLNRGWREGIASSIRAGVAAVRDRAVPGDGVLLMVCDQPLLSADVVRRVRESFDGRPGRRVACAYGGTVGVPALFEFSLFERLSALQGDRGAKPLLEEAGDELVRVSWPDGAVEIDRPEDLERL
jgi:molybdenum cofactor cytidylyltransferase